MAKKKQQEKPAFIQLDESYTGTHKTKRLEFRCSANFKSVITELSNRVKKNEWGWKYTETEIIRLAIIAFAKEKGVIEGRHEYYL